MEVITWKRRKHRMEDDTARSKGRIGYENVCEFELASTRL